MKYDIKPNQSTIFNAPPVTKKEIKAIKIDVFNKTVKTITVNNSLNYIKKYLDLYKCKILPLEKDTMDCFIVSVDEDEDTKKKPSFRFKGNNPTKHYGNAILVKIPKSHDYEKLQNTKVTVQSVLERIEFDD